MGRTFLVDHSFSSRSSSLHSRCRPLSSSRSEIHFCRSSGCHPRTIPRNSRRSCGVSDLGLSASLTPLISDIKNETISWKSRLRLSSTSRVPSIQSPERSVSPSQISQQRRPLCLAQNQHAPAVQSGQIAVKRAPHRSHRVLSAPSFSRVLVRKSPRSKSPGMGFGPPSEISAGAPRHFRKDHPISTDSIVATHSSSFLLSIRSASSSGAPVPSGRRPPLRIPPYK